MKPRMLKISGLNSFKEEQTIDFERLTERGLFGIFGPTGSGKSTILDAITIALYGKISRNTNEFINTSEEAANISYEFEIGKGSERKTYTVERRFKRKKGGSYDTKHALLMELNGDSCEIRAQGAREVEKEIKEIIGLTAEDFTRSVVLPQGKFNEFLKLSGQDRRNMLERIFNLEEYGIRLMKKIRDARNERQRACENVSGELKSYEGISREAYDAVEEELKILFEEEKTLRDEKDRLQKEFENARDIWDKQQELKSYEDKKAELDKKLQDMEYKKVKLKKAQDALIVKPFIEDAEDTKVKIEANEKEIVRLTELLEDMEKSLNNTENEYNQALERKNSEIPNLIEKEMRLKSAIEIEDEIIKLKRETQELRDKLAQTDKEIKTYEDEINDIKCRKEKAVHRINEIEQRIDAIKVDPDYRRKVQEAYDTEREFVRVSKEKKDKEDKINLLNKSIEDKKGEYTKIIYLKDENLRNIEDVFKKHEELLNNCPGDSNTIIDSKNILEAMRLKLNSALENDKKRLELESAYKKASAQRKGWEEKAGQLNNSIHKTKEALQKIREEIEDIRLKNMAGIIAKEVKEGEPCPVCGSIHHPNLAERVEIIGLDEKLKLQNQYEKDIEKLQKELNTSSGQLERYRAEENLKGDDLEKVIKSLEGIDVEGLKSDFTRLEKDFNELNFKVQSWNIEKEEMEKRLTALKDERSKIEKEEARLGADLVNSQRLLDDNNMELKDISKRYDEMQKSYVSCKNELNIDNIGLKLQEIMKNEKEIVSLQDEMKKLNGIKEELDTKRQELDDKKNVLNEEKTKIREIGNQKIQTINQSKEKMIALSDGKEPRSYIKDVKAQINSINQAEETLRKALELQKNNRQNIVDNRLKAVEKGSNLKIQFKEQNDRLKKSLIENGFSDEAEALSCILSKDMMESIEMEIKTYENDRQYVERNIEKFKLELQGNFIDEESYITLRNNLNSIIQALDAKAKEIGAKSENLRDIGSKLQKAEELTKKKREIEHKLDLLEDIDKLMQGNRFVEYVASSQLKYIAKEASKRLKEITRERYALELKEDTGDFLMRDDFEGGTKRSIDTLSGGETFLTSLSLALALSSHIQLKGSAPLEFFFLDEGFGTLDSELLETVISSLERLHNDKMSVGIISHVEEIKNRVPVKLIVTPAKQGGSGTRVEVQYS